jgi:hypothetical protein
MAVACHTVLLPDIRQGMLEGIRKTCDGPLTIASDLMVWNVTKESITMRMVSFPDLVTQASTAEACKNARRSGNRQCPGMLWMAFGKALLPHHYLKSKAIKGHGPGLMPRSFDSKDDFVAALPTCCCKITWLFFLTLTVSATLLWHCV